VRNLCKSSNQTAASIRDLLDSQVAGAQVGLVRECPTDEMTRDRLEPFAHDLPRQSLPGSFDAEPVKNTRGHSNADPDPAVSVGGDTDLIDAEYRPKQGCMENAASLGQRCQVGGRRVRTLARFFEH
jgi:hypothetical protein